MVTRPDGVMLPGTFATLARSFAAALPAGRSTSVAPVILQPKADVKCGPASFSAARVLRRTPSALRLRLLNAHAQRGTRPVTGTAIVKETARARLTNDLRRSTNLIMVINKSRTPA